MTTQIALLIDTYVDGVDSNQLASVSNSICLTAFRLLHFLSSKFEKKGIERISKQSHTAVKWGYKFFNSREYVTRIEQHRLRDFKLKYFEEFENEVQRRLENKPQCLKTTVKKIKPCECTSKALTELLSDFPWERPDITSPVRGRKKKKETSFGTNLVILFTRCPKSGPELKLFTGKQVPDSEVFLDSLLPPALFHQFCNVSQLSLNWIDTDELTSLSLVSTDLESIRIVQDAVLKARGKLLPVTAVVHCGSPHFSSLSALEIFRNKDGDTQVQCKPSDKSTFLLPFTTTSDYFLFKQKEQNYMCEQKTHYTASLQISENQSCSLTLKPSVKEFRQSNMVDVVSLASKQDLEALSSDQTISARADRLFEQLEMPVLQLYSVLLNKEIVLPQGSRKFVCSEKINQTEGNVSTGGLLRKLIDKMKRANSSLVLLCEETKQLLLFEPLTTYTASLWLVPTGKQLWLEKELFSQKTTITSPAVKEDNHGFNSLIQRLVSNGQYNNYSGPLQLDEKSGTSYDVTMMDRWHIPGSTQAESLSSLISKLNERINELDFLTEAEAGTLRQLQKAYRQENKPPGLRDTSMANNDDSSQFSSALNDLSKVDSSKASVKSSRQSVTRGELIISLSKTKEEVKERGQTEKEVGNVGGKKEKEKPEIAAQLCEFKSTGELKEYLDSMYGRVITGEVTNIDITVQTMATVVLHFMKNNRSEDPEKCSKNLLEECIIISGTKLREKYAKKSDETDKQEKMIEYQFQVLLRLEILSTLVSKDQTLGEEDSNDEIVGLLRTLSFISEPGLLSKFLERTVLYNYVHTIPKTLANIYDELMQPLPDLLANQLSPNTSGDHSDINSSLIGQEDHAGPPSAHTRSHGSAGPPSSQPGSNKSVGMDMISATQKGGRKLIHHPSLADFGAKRQIVVQKIPKAKEKSSKKRKRKPSGKSEKDKISKRLFDGARGGTKLERRQSVAVMQRTHKTPKKSKSKYVLKSPGRGFVSPRRNLVAETPCHKQVSHILRYKPSKQDQDGDMPETGEEVVEESPVKQVQGASFQDTPTKAKRAKALLRRSFYSAGPVKRTRNLTKYFQLADKIAGRERHKSGNSGQPKLPKLISFEAPSDVKSPSKNSSFLLSQLMSSPSPAKRTPRKGFLSPSPGKRTARGLSLSRPSPAKHTQRQLVLASPSASKKTPRKLTATPSKLVTDSPSSRTRAKYDGTFVMPSAELLMSPVSRRQSPRVLAADSSTKVAEVSPDKTPVKSPVCGTITTGLDSPSHSSRIRTASTPTRKSVRAALFAKSPVIKKCNSSISGSEISSLKSKLMSKYSSPKKRLVSEHLSWTSPRKQKANENSSFMSPRKMQTCENKQIIPLQKLVPADTVEINELKEKHILNPEGSNSVRVKSDSLNKTENAMFEKCSSLHFGLTQNSKTGPTIIQRTPSPSKKKKTKTPDSFDKWHRRKPRSSQSSPSIRKKSPEKGSVKSVEGTAVDLNSSENMEVNVTEQNIVTTAPLKSSLSQNRDFSLGRKRSLITSPSKVEESPGKRRRISRLKSVGINSGGSRQDLIGSQGFDVTGSFSEYSQKSNVSSLDYFSASNDEVFLSQNENLSQEDVEMENLENCSNRSSDVRKFSHSSINKGWMSPRHKTLERLTSSEFSPSGMQDQRSDSPVFGSSKKSTRNRNMSGENSKFISNLEKSCVDNHIDKESPTARNSPGFRRSPANRKFSPVVSAKSLMHLIQSPLLTSPGDEDKNVLDSGSPRNRRNVGDRSRRSLKMQY